MKRTEKFALTALVAGVLVICALSALYGVTSQRRNAARAKIRPPEMVAVYEELRAKASSASSRGADGAFELQGEDDLDRLLNKIQAFDALFKKANAAYEQTEWREVWRWLENPTSESPGDGVEQFRELLQANQPLLDEIRSLAAQGGPVHLLDLKNGIKGRTHLLGMYKLGNFLTADALVASEEGETDRAAADVLALLQLSRALASEPLLSSQGVRFQLAQRAFDALRSLPQDSTGSDAHERIAAELAQDVQREAFAESVRGDAVAIEAEFDNLRRTGLENANLDPIEAAIGRLYISSPVMHSDEATILDTLYEMQLVAALPYYEREPHVEIIEQSTDDLSWMGIVARRMLSTLRPLHDAQGSHEAAIGLAQLGLALESFHHDNGAYPTSLGELADRIPGGIPVDPFTGRPYTYQPTENGFTLYSVGLNLRDDGGRHDEREGDIVWRGAAD